MLSPLGTIHEIKSMFSITKGDMKYIVRMMNKDMNRGLKKEGHSSMQMALAHLTCIPTGLYYHLTLCARFV